MYAERSYGRIQNEAYIWQRQWNPEVSEAISQAASEISGFAVLAAEVSFRNGQIEDVVSVPIDYESLRQTHKPVALALRIGPFSGDFRQNQKITELLSDIACSLMEDARNNRIEPSELQIDFDCAESKLVSYVELLKVLKAKVGALQFADSEVSGHPIPIVITVLPCWLKHREFKALSQASDGFVLQVHSIERPKSPDAPMELCNIASSLKWVEKAAKFGVPFRVALPTYGYIAGFDEAGRFIGLAAEGPRQDWPEGAILRSVSSDPEKIAELVRKWQKDRPANMQGIIWYRLPVKSDRLNWKWQTLSIVMNGQKPKPDVKVDVKHPQAGFAQITLKNTGQLDYIPKNKVEIECDEKEITAAEGMNGFIFDGSNLTHSAFKFKGENGLLRIRPGEQLLVGWLRCNSDIEVKAHVSEVR